ncbi:MAG: hypothetical protein K2H34_09680 [Lachnospiraceae bacterium]|nr:hypothetical protein [Lachnospiraceae bacterium]
MPAEWVPKRTAIIKARAKNNIKGANRFTEECLEEDGLDTEDLRVDGL